MRPSRWMTRWGYPNTIYDYGYDVGNLHCIDRRLYLAVHDHRPAFEVPHLRFSPADWSRE